eukprot:SAG31_NODE_5474_length_2518_cov_544.966102_3_plen_56_part_01
MVGLRRSSRRRGRKTRTADVVWAGAQWAAGPKRSHPRMRFGMQVSRGGLLPAATVR